MQQQQVAGASGDDAVEGGAEAVQGGGSAGTVGASGGNAGSGDTPLLLVFLVARGSASAEIASAEHARLVSCLTAEPFATPLRLSIAVEQAESKGEAAAGSGETWLVGAPFVEERLLGLTYQVSPAAFFQVNTPGAEQLCELLQSLAHIGPKTVLLDVCCGTGTIGLSLASSVKRVVGIEICAPAVLDAKANARRNGIGNAH